jgi:hypothetical protein
MATSTIAINDDRVTPLSNQEQATTGFNAKFSVLASDIAASGLTGSSDIVIITLGNSPAKWYVDRAMVNVSTAFAGTTAMTIIVGSTSDNDAFVTSTSVLTAGVIGTAGFAPVTVTNSSSTSAVSLQATFTNATGGSPSALTAGALDIYLRVKDTTELP